MWLNMLRMSRLSYPESWRVDRPSPLQALGYLNLLWLCSTDLWLLNHIRRGKGFDLAHTVQVPGQSPILANALHAIHKHDNFTHSQVGNSIILIYIWRIYLDHFTSHLMAERCRIQIAVRICEWFGIFLSWFSRRLIGDCHGQGLFLLGLLCSEGMSTPYPKWAS